MEFWRKLNQNSKKPVLYKLSLVLIFGSFVFFSQCITPKCRDDMAFNFDKRGRPIKGGLGKKKNPPAILMTRCSKHGCKTIKIHCHGNYKYRGSPWWKKQNPQTGEVKQGSKDT